MTFNDKRNEACRHGHNGPAAHREVELDRSNSTGPFVAEVGLPYRISFAWWKGLDEGMPDLDQIGPQFVGASVNFFPDIGYVVNNGPGFTKLAGGEAPRRRIVTVIVAWPTDAAGRVDIDRLAAGGQVVQPWVLSTDKFACLKAVNREFPLGSHDLMLRCSNLEHQRMTFTPCRDSILRSLLRERPMTTLAATIVDQARQVAAKLQRWSDG